MGTYVHEDRGGQLAAARAGLAIGPGGVGAHIAKQFFRDEEATHMENITKSVNFACGQLRLGKDASADAKALVVKACDGRWGEGEWTTMLTGACVYAASRQNALPITVRDVMDARLIAWPLTLFHCCIVTDHGGAVIVARPEIARSLRTNPVWIAGAGESMGHSNMLEMEDFTATSASRSSATAYEMAGLGPEDMEMAMIYDSFTITAASLARTANFAPGTWARL